MVSIFNKDLCISLALVRSDPLVPVPYMHAGAVSAGPACVVFHRLIYVSCYPYVYVSAWLDFGHGSEGLAVGLRLNTAGRREKGCMRMRGAPPAGRGAEGRLVAFPPPLKA